MATGVNEKCLLFADDIVYIQHYTFKIKNKLIENATDGAKILAQAYLNSLEWWMNLWHLSLAPHKCAQITFLKAANTEKDDLEVSLYGAKIPYEKNPTFLGIVFDVRMSFEAHGELFKKIKDRMNILKVLSYDRQWSLDTKQNFQN